MPINDNPLVALWTGWSDTKRAAFKVAATAALIAGIGIGTAVIYSSGDNGGTATSTTTSTQGNSASGGSGPTSSSTQGSDAVKLEITAYDSPPCMLPIIINSLEPSDADLDPSAAVGGGGTFPGPCTFTLTFKKGTQISWTVRDASNGGWVAEHFVTGPCPFTFTADTSHFAPTPADLTCSTTLDKDTTLGITYEAVGEYRGSGKSVVTVDYPHCLPQGAWNFPNTPQPAGCMS